jgi:hypothetical protein
MNGRALTKDKKCNAVAPPAISASASERRQAPEATGPAAAMLTDAHAKVVPGRLDTGQGPPIAMSRG